MNTKHFDRIAKAYAARSAIKPGLTMAAQVKEDTVKILTNWAERKDLEPAQVISFFSLA